MAGIGIATRLGAEAAIEAARRGIPQTVEIEEVQRAVALMGGSALMARRAFLERARRKLAGLDVSAIDFELDAIRLELSGRSHS